MLVFHKPKGRKRKRRNQNGWLSLKLFVTLLNVAKKKKSRIQNKIKNFKNNKNCEHKRKLK